MAKCMYANAWNSENLSFYTWISVSVFLGRFSNRITWNSFVSSSGLLISLRIYEGKICSVHGRISSYLWSYSALHFLGMCVCLGLWTRSHCSTWFSSRTLSARRTTRTTRWGPATPAPSAPGGRTMRMFFQISKRTIFVYLCWPIESSYIEVQMRGDGGGGRRLRGLSQWVQLCTSRDVKPNKLWRSTSIFNLW
jgi:hypothetical protein